MEKQLRKVKKYLSILSTLRYANEHGVGDIGICHAGYKTSNMPPALSAFLPFEEGSLWGTGYDSHAWFHFSFSIPQEMAAVPVQLYISSDKEGWDAANPQFIAYVNGKMRQGLDINHTFLALDDAQDYDVYIYAYTGPRVAQARFYAKLRNVNVQIEQLYYDILVPFEMLEYLSPHSYEYAEILHRLDRAVTLLDLYDLQSGEFAASVTQACAYMREEFYGRFCADHRRIQAPATVGIGHTHIDCAWKWTLQQTREKVQRSFSTALELMKRYPEYRFMSSQALLYQYLKEEAPELYAEVKQRIQEGRWECEGAMWVEADCNLTSGESLVRQILYGKRFFEREFGVNSHILWLPDVFGYSAALPQILCKSGVDWFVTSKISWNDTNTLPFDAFKWIGIDGTAINTYFLTAQDQTSSEPDRYTTYVGNTGAKMVAGTWNRFHQKGVTNEALLTFGYGDGGGGPTSEHLEMGRRLAHGIPGSPNYRIDFAGNFFERLTKKAEESPLLPKWRGELYLEYHRGTYTSIAKNKRSNRKGEFLYQDTELLACLDKALCDTPFPKQALHEGWELLLTNQFHDIIPGSSIREVYEQCDLDYQRLMKIAQGISEAARQHIAARLDRKGGYVVFNPHSFVGSGVTNVDGKTTLVGNLPSKGYCLTNAFVQSNSVLIQEKRVETNRFVVTFDDCWQIISIYDKKAFREVITAGQAANEIRLYADHPDKYDAWEWQEYSLDKYTPLTDVRSCEVVDDGARRGLRIVRTYKQSTITQTVWFWDDLARIDFDTEADWHQQHVMVKAAFPVDVNADKATYEIQFGALERPTHKNTTWDNAKFEVCAQKYADLSDGGYGVSLVNDCKYGHDIHDGVMMLSLLRSPTDPYEDADQGAMACLYSLCPHTGCFAMADTVKTAYQINYPVIAVKAKGEESSIPEVFSAVTADRENVVCETVKETEDGEDTIIRLYESKNIRTDVRIRSDIPFVKACLCDLMENEISELAIENGMIKTHIGGYEILTIKLCKYP